MINGHDHGARQYQKAAPGSVQYQAGRSIIVNGQPVGDQIIDETVTWKAPKRNNKLFLGCLAAVFLSGMLASGGVWLLWWMVAR